VTTFSATRQITADPDLCFAVAADVAAYKDFLPLLQRSAILGERQALPDGEKFQAELAVAFDKLKLRESFVSTVQTDRKRRTVSARSSDGPFKALAAQWKIRASGSGSEVSIVIDYTFKNMLLQMAAAATMNYAVDRVMAAFEQRVRDMQPATA
jgi:coenzyme Q-binding protein COQ10